MDTLENLPQADDKSVAPTPQVESVEDVARAAYDSQIKNVEAAKKEEKPEPDKPAAERVRALDGKFAKADDTPAIDKPAPDKVASAPKPVAAQTPEPAAPVADETPTVRPPPGWSPASKVAFDALPESVKTDIVKREQEVNQGFAKLSEYKPIEKYVDMAKQSGTTLDRALDNYTGIETLLRKDIFSGFEAVMKNVGVDPRVMAQAYLNRAGGNSSTGAPTQSTATQQQHIDPNAIVNQAVSAIRAEQQQSAMQAEISKFSADPKNRFYENVKPAMAQLLSIGMASNLQDAYDKACRLDPTVSPLINQQAPTDQAAVKANIANQARNAAKATIGAPSSGNLNGASNPNKNDPMDVARAALAAQRGRT